FSFGVTPDDIYDMQNAIDITDNREHGHGPTVWSPTGRFCPPTRMQPADPAATLLTPLRPPVIFQAATYARGGPSVAVSEDRPASVRRIGRRTLAVWRRGTGRRWTGRRAAPPRSRGSPRWRQSPRGGYAGRPPRPTVTPRRAGMAGPRLVATWS